MSKADDVTNLREEIAKDPQLLSQLQGINDIDVLADKIAGIARQKGYDLSAHDIAGAIGSSESGELSEKELSAVSGGGAWDWVPDTVQDTKCMKLYGWCP